MSIFSVSLMNFSIRVCPQNILKEDFVNSQQFREMNINTKDIFFLKQFAKENKMTPGEVTALYICENNNKKAVCDMSSWDLFFNKICYKNKQKKNFDYVKQACEAIFNDLEYFPVLNYSKNEFPYSNSWFGNRDFGGKRRHEGTDIMAEQNIRGVFPVISMTDGVVEKIGWLKLGGYRIGIRSSSGGYFYYAHLDSYSTNYKAGDKITAGEIIGYMGDSGYGPEKTTGQFDVHLHLGIYVNDKTGKEISINPYYVLKSVENVK